MIEKILDSAKERGNKVKYLVIYLAPQDYHRYHSPAYFTANYRRHIAGYLEPVMPSYLKYHKDVLRDNERVNVLGEWRHGFFAISFIGALNVGSIKLHFDKDLLSNQKNPPKPYFQDKNYLTLMNQSDSLDVFGNQYLKIPKLNFAIESPIKYAKEQPEAQTDITYSSDDLLQYMNEFDIKDMPNTFSYSMS